MSALQREGILCPGDRPWLGVGAEEICGEALVGALINQTNLYFAHTASAIFIPDIAPVSSEVARLRELLGANAPLLMKASMLRGLGSLSDAADFVSKALEKEGDSAIDADVESALAGLLDPASAQLEGAAIPAKSESELVALRRAEFNVLRRADATIALEDLHVVPSPVPKVLAGRIAKVQLIERLRETRAFYGFDRLTPTSERLARMPDVAMRQLFRIPPSALGDRWLPAIVVYGEGIYLELEEEFVLSWQERNRTWLSRRLSDRFIARIAEQPQTLAASPVTRSWASRYLLVHSLAHALINQMVFECGYSSASLRERLFVSEDSAAPMAGLLIYISAGDSEGTLGGLVRLGRTDRFGDVFRRAIMRIAWCSADPICSEELGGQGSQLANLGACHACILLPETSCETINHGLDRAMLVGTPTERSGGAFVDFSDQLVQFES